MNEFNISVDPDLIKASKDFMYSGHPYAYGSPLDLYKWRKICKEKGIANTSYAKHYFGKQKKSYTDDEISYILTEAFYDLVDSGCFQPGYAFFTKYPKTNFNDPKNENLLPKLDKIIKLENYEIQYSSLVKDNSKQIAIHVRNKLINKNVGLVFLEIFKHQEAPKYSSLLDDKILNTSVGGYVSNKYTVNRLMEDICTTILGLHASSPIMMIRQ